MNVDAITTELIQRIYGHVPDVLKQGIETLQIVDSRPSRSELWDQRDEVLITYADQVRAEGMTPLRAQLQFLCDHQLPRSIDCVHLLPFCPYTSDDGFSVVDYLAVDPHSGSWDDISAIGKSFDLMFDLVLNHVSQKHAWFQAYLAGDPEFADFFIEVDPNVDLSAVVRPRSLPLLTEFETANGRKHIWTTFSADQVDLNYANPKVLLAMLEILVEYARRGARIIRLDAVAFLWKEIGTSCIHLPQTHAIVQLMRRVLDHVAPGTLVLTETNVPHRENISYFGDGTNEAHMVYQFSLPPLLLDAIHSGDTSVLTHWLKSLRPPSDMTTFFNFTASHDGIGVRPLEGLVPPERVQALVDRVLAHGGCVSMRRNADGTESPYELNITYLDAVADRSRVDPADHARRFLATQVIMLSMQGMPAVYFHSLVGTPNDIQGVLDSGQNRRINRHKYTRQELEEALSQPHSLQRRVFDGYRHVLALRREQAAFHPNAEQRVLDLPTDGLVGFARTAVSGQQIYVIANLTDQPRKIPAESVPLATRFDLLGQERLFGEMIALRPFQVRWITED